MSKTTTARKLNLTGDVLTIKVEGKPHRRYRLERIEDEGGTRLGFRLNKDTGEQYDVDTVDGRCDCMAGLQRGRCVHIDAIFHLLDLRKID